MSDPTATPRPKVPARSSASSRRIGRIQDRATFADLRARGFRVRQGPLTITFLAVAAESPTGTRPIVRVAFAIGKRVGHAVIRNRLRRRLRAVFAEADPGTVPAGAYLVSAHPDASVLTYHELREHVQRALTRINAKVERA